MRCSVRCHAVIAAAGGVYKGGVVSFEGLRCPRAGERLDVTDAGDVSVCCPEGEVHSTVDYNGIAVVGDADVDDLSLTAAGLSAAVLSVLARGIIRSNRIQFIPLGV